MDRIGKFGEVFTPPELVNEMLDSLPKEVWTNPDLKWLDNSCGSGNFLIEVKNRLSETFTAPQIADMVYGVDIQQDNVDACKQRTGLTNIVMADSLKFGYWDCKFDVIVGNPPYNKEKKGKKGNNCNPLWPDFVDVSFKFLKDDGYLLLVHPPLWRKPDHRLLNKILNNRVIKIKMFDIKEGKRLFNCGTKVDYYCLQKSDVRQSTEIIDELGITTIIDLSNVPFIPNHSIKECFEYFGKINTFDVLYNCIYHHYTSKSVSKEKTATHTLPCVYLVNNKGIHYYYSKEDKGHFGVPKVIIPMGKFQPINDYSGSFGMCEVAFAIKAVDKGECTSIIEALNSDEFGKIISACKWKTFQLDWRLFKYLRKDKILGKKILA